ncbi:MAG: glycosyltransferase family 2 protein [Bacteroidota bacterium]
MTSFGVGLLWCINYIFLTCLLVYALIQLRFLIAYIRRKEEQPPAVEEVDWPSVTVQLPIYNEGDVIYRLIDTMMQLDYPTDKIEVQVLDDSTDETTGLLKKHVAYWKAQGRKIVYLKRPDRKGFRAGNLQWGLHKAEGEYLAIFDADFVPPRDFLRKTVPYFLAERKLAMVQTRMDHLNRHQNFITEMMALGVDTYYSLEADSRNRLGYFSNFNGSGAVWRKESVIDAGEWQDDTLTEDFDISYRAQLKGWKFKYLENVGCKAELPYSIIALKLQQYRWNKGNSETAAKHMKSLLTSNFPISVKFQGVFHLFNSLMYISSFLLALLSIPIFFTLDQVPFVFQAIGGVISIIVVLIFTSFYWYAAARNKNRTHRSNFLYFIRTYPLFMVVALGISFNNTVAAIKGILRIESPYITTPKAATESKKKETVENFKYQNLMELFLCLYFLGGVVASFFLNNFVFFTFHLSLATSFFILYYFSTFPPRARVQVSN